MAREQEVKLTVEAGSVPGIRQWLSAAATEILPEQCLENTYFDSADARLNRHRVALRIRSSGDTWTQTLKTKGATVRGVHDRQEWDWPLAGAALDTAVLEHSPIAGLVEPATLQAVFSTNFERVAWLWRDSDDEIEVALDQGTVRADTLEMPLLEVELELKNGNPGRLMEQAQVLSERCAVFLNPVSKAEQGYWLAGLYEPGLEGGDGEESLDVWLKALGYFWLTGRAEFLSRATSALSRIHNDRRLQRRLDDDQWQQLLSFHDRLAPGPAASARRQLLSDRVLGQCQLALVRAG